MWRSDDVVLARVDEGLLLYSRFAPEDEDNPISLFRKRTDSCISEALPSHPLMTRGLSLTDSQYGIQEEYSLYCPVSEISMSSLYSGIGLEFLEYISQAWLRFISLWYRK